jgi:hypothetical protein
MEGFYRRRRERPCPPFPSKLKWWFGGGFVWPKFGGAKGDSHFYGEENIYSDVECSDVESDSGDLGNGTGI